MNTNDLYRLTLAKYDGHTFTHPDHVWTYGEILHSWAFCAPYTTVEHGDRLEVASVPRDGREGQRQAWERYRGDDGRVR